MTTSKHTPGPWWSTPSAAVLCGNPDDPEIVADCAPTDLMAVQDDERKVANARLIAAAPELLEALERVAYEFQSYMSDSEQRHTLDDVRAAIAKAKGG